MGSWRLGKEEFGLAWLGLLFMLPYLTYLAMRCIMHRLGVVWTLMVFNWRGWVKGERKIPRNSSPLCARLYLAATKVEERWLGVGIYAEILPCSAHDKSQPSCDSIYAL